MGASIPYEGPITQSPIPWMEEEEEEDEEQQQQHVLSLSQLTFMVAIALFSHLPIFPMTREERDVDGIFSYTLSLSFSLGECFFIGPVFVVSDERLLTRS